MLNAETITLSAAEMARALAITPRRLNQLVAEGVVSRAAGRRYNLEGVREYVLHVKRDEETRRERRELLRAQTEAVRARSAAKLGRAFTHAEVMARLDEPLVELLAIRNAASWNRARMLEAGLDQTLVDRLAGEQWRELAACATHVRKLVEAAFPPPVEPPMRRESGTAAPRNGRRPGKPAGKRRFTAAKAHWPGC